MVEVLHIQVDDLATVVLHFDGVWEGLMWVKGSEFGSWTDARWDVRKVPCKIWCLVIISWGTQARACVHHMTDHMMSWHSRELPLHALATGATALVNCKAS
jgi:hypothetical protein